MGVQAWIYSEGPGEDTSVALKLETKGRSAACEWGWLRLAGTGEEHHPTRSCSLLTPHPAVSKAGHKVQINRFLSPVSINHCIFFSWSNSMAVLHSKEEKGKGRWILITKIDNILEMQRQRGKEKDPSLVNPSRRFSFEGS